MPLVDKIAIDILCESDGMHADILAQWFEMLLKKKKKKKKKTTPLHCSSMGFIWCNTTLWGGGFGVGRVLRIPVRSIPGLVWWGGYGRFSLIPVHTIAVTG